MINVKKCFACLFSLIFFYGYIGTFYAQNVDIPTIKATDIPVINITCPNNIDNFLQAICDDIYLKSGEKFIPKRPRIGEGCTGVIYKLEGINKDLCVKICKDNVTQLNSSFKKGHELYYKITGQPFSENYLENYDLSKSLNLNLPIAGYQSKDFYGNVLKFNNLFPLGVIISKNIKIQENYVASIIYDLLNAINHLHSANYIQRDMFPFGNVMFHNNENIIECYLIDAESIQCIDSEQELVPWCWCDGYKGPETIIENNEDYNTYSVVFIIGIIFWELIYGNCPFAGKDFIFQGEKHKQAIKYLPECLEKMQSDKNLSENCKNLLSKLLDPNKNNRISASEALKHDFFKFRKSVETNFLLNLLI